MKKIALGGKAGERWVMVDDADFECLNSFNWHNRRGYAARKVLMGEPDYDPAKQRTITMHQYIMGGLGRAHIDHRDRNGLNNQRANLRYASAAESSANRGIIGKNRSGYKGLVYHSKGRKRWQAYVQVNGKRYSAGYFLTPIEAAAAYNELAKKHHGDFAFQNPL